MYQPLYGPKGLVIFDHPYNADYALIHPDSIWEERHARIIFYERDALVVPFADFRGMAGGSFPYRVEAERSSSWGGALCGSVRIRSGLVPRAGEAGDDCSTDVCFGDEPVAVDLRAEVRGVGAGGEDDDGRGGQPAQLAGDAEPSVRRGCHIDEYHLGPQRARGGKRVSAGPKPMIILPLVTAAPARVLPRQSPSLTVTDLASAAWMPWNDSWDECFVAPNSVYLACG